MRLFGVDEPARIFLLGTDGFGRDQLSRLLHGARISLFAGLLAAVLALGMGWILGMASGYYGGWVDALLMRSADLFLALPWLYLLFAVRAVLPLHVSAGRPSCCWWPSSPWWTGRDRRASCAASSSARASAPTCWPPGDSGRATCT